MSGMSQTFCALQEQEALVQRELHGHDLMRKKVDGGASEAV